MMLEDLIDKLIIASEDSLELVFSSKLIPFLDYRSLIKEKKEVYKLSSFFDVIVDVKNFDFYYKKTSPTIFYDILFSIGASFFYTYSKYKRKNIVEHELKRIEFTFWLYHALKNNEKLNEIYNKKYNNIISEYYDLSDFGPVKIFLTQYFKKYFIMYNSLESKSYENAKINFLLGGKHSRYYYGFNLSENKLDEFVKNILPTKYKIKNILGIRYELNKVDYNQNYYLFLIKSTKNLIISEDFFGAIVLSEKDFQKHIKNGDALIIDFYKNGKKLRTYPDLYQKKIKLNKNHIKAYLKYNRKKSEMWYKLLHQEEQFPGDYFDNNVIDFILQIASYYEYYGLLSQDNFYSITNSE